MGYTHYWRGISIFTPEFISDVYRIIEESGIPVAGPMGTDAPEIDIEGILLNGVAPEDDYETFSLDAGSIEFNFCKTARRPYDTVITTVLLRQAHYSEAFRIDSDGTWDEWQPARTLYASIFGEEANRPEGV